jgi:predicted ferric reductase
MMAIFTLGADEIRIKQMQEIASAWGLSGKYSDSKRLLDDVKKKKIAYVLVVDPEAIDEDVRRQLKEMNVQIINFHDKKRLEGLIRI